LQQMPFGFRSRNLLPTYSGSSEVATGSIPLWCLMLPCAVWFAVALWRRRYRINILCPCGYDARGLDVCPECGRDVKA
jgi:hypothetical protein